ncbi:MAG: sulfotransferase [Myxococcota bacterium]
MSGATSAGNPIVIVGCGYRCGSTLLQRILCAAPGTMLWGESNDALPLVLDAYVRIGLWTGMSMRQKTGLETRGPEAWIANLQPPLPHTSEATALWIATRYARMLDGSPAQRWGMKDLSLEPLHVSTLLTTLPDARVIFMLRHPRPMLASMLGTGWFRATPPDAIVRRWIERSRWACRSSDARLRVVRYEALTTHPAATLAEVAQHLGMPPDALDARIATLVVRGTEEPPRLDAAAEAALASPALIEAMAELGYA